MTIVYIEIEESKSKHKIWKKTIVAVCDVCKKQFKRKWTESSQQKIEICSRNCRYEGLSKNGILYQKNKQRYFKNHGIYFCTQNELTKEKCKSTMVKNHGVSCIFQRPDIRAHALSQAWSFEAIEKREQSIIDEYGSREKFTEINLEKGKKSLFENWGVSHNFQIEWVKENRKQTWIDNWGVDNPFKSEEIKNIAKQTMIKRFGVEFFPQSIRFKTLMIVNSKERCKKSHQTMKRNGSYKVSVPENKLFEILCQQFGYDNVERQVFMNSCWPIDFYVKPPIDTYYQCDGVYWHGLNRRPEEIAKFKTERDVNIFQKLITDKKQNEWFFKQNLRLVRITDNELKHFPIDFILKKL